MSSLPPSLVTMLRREKTRPNISFSSSACERPLWALGAEGASLGVVEDMDALDVGRVVLVVVVDEEDVGRGVQRRLYMHSAGVD